MTVFIVNLKFVVCYSRKKKQSLVLMEDWNMGMRFSPTDEELIKEYLWMRLNNGTFHAGIIKELNIYDYEPWQLQSMQNACVLFIFYLFISCFNGGN